MKRIGLPGGMSWESTALYYRLLNSGVAERLGGLHSVDCVLASVDFAPVAEPEGRWEEAGATLAARAGDLRAAGADLLLLCTNTGNHDVRNRTDAPAVLGGAGEPPSSARSPERASG